MDKIKRNCYKIQWIKVQIYDNCLNICFFLFVSVKCISLDLQFAYEYRMYERGMFHLNMELRVVHQMFSSLFTKSTSLDSSHFFCIYLIKFVVFKLKTNS